MNAYVWSAIALGVLLLATIVIGRCLEDDDREEDIQQALEDLDPHGLKRSFERRDIQ